jgi:hypothetical protein
MSIQQALFIQPVHPYLQYLYKSKQQALFIQPLKKPAASTVHPVFEEASRGLKPASRTVNLSLVSTGVS